MSDLSVPRSAKAPGWFDRIGIGHPGHKDRVSGYVLSDFAKAEQDGLDDLLRGIADGAPDLAAGDKGRFMNAIALRMQPVRETSSEVAERPAEQPPAEAPDTRSAMQKLMDKFR